MPTPAALLALWPSLGTQAHTQRSLSKAASLMRAEPRHNDHNWCRRFNVVGWLFIWSLALLDPGTHSHILYLQLAIISNEKEFFPTFETTKWNQRNKIFCKPRFPLDEERWKSSIGFWLERTLKRPDFHHPAKLPGHTVAITAPGWKPSRGHVHTCDSASWCNRKWDIKAEEERRSKGMKTDLV